ncbi:hypothetical protein GCM10011409_26910 [Lentibacillus populi]|uniref:Uncharacterized protein n=1 Tax=Lentibacillus populi TaxID=1827502 RepID=A0A9W5TYN4_9BACI|nr:hypothetical protein [Lentibacillus populi]GGB48007.1 hypothetical protein GCM10011409_26910 [Lentibacillus populi]
MFIVYMMRIIMNYLPIFTELTQLKEAILLIIGMINNDVQFLARRFIK